MDCVSATEVLNLAENLKSFITRCEEENYHIQEILTKTEIPDAGGHLANIRNSRGDARDSRQAHFQREHFRELMNSKTEENLSLRESNIKLRIESKIQDEKIRELNHDLMLQNRLNQKVESQRSVLCHLRKVVDEKSSEIRNLKKNLEDVKLLRSKLHSKSKCFEAVPDATSKSKCFQAVPDATSKSKASSEVKSKLELLLSQLNQLDIDLELAKSPLYCSNVFIDKIESAFSKLALIKSKLGKREVENIEKLTRNVPVQDARFKTDRFIQVPNDGCVNKSDGFTVVRENIYNYFSREINSQIPPVCLRMGRRRSQSI